MVTLGTGIGTALFCAGRLFPNTELGHLELHGGDAEKWASAQVRTVEGLDFPAWSTRVNEYLARLHALLWPDLFILGGAMIAYDLFGDRWNLMDTLTNIKADSRTAGISVFVYGPLDLAIIRPNLVRNYPGLRFLVQPGDASLLRHSSRVFLHLCRRQSEPVTPARQPRLGPNRHPEQRAVHTRSTCSNACLDRGVERPRNGFISRSCSRSDS